MDQRDKVPKHGGSYLSPDWAAEPSHPYGMALSPSKGEHWTSFRPTWVVAGEQSPTPDNTNSKEMCHNERPQNPSDR